MRLLHFFFFPFFFFFVCLFLLYFFLFPRAISTGQGERTHGAGAEGQYKGIRARASKHGGRKMIAQAGIKAERDVMVALEAATLRAQARSHVVKIFLFFLPLFFFFLWSGRHQILQQ